MSEKSSVLRAFNVHLIDFLNDISQIITDNDKILELIVFFENAKKLNPTLIIKCWYKFVYLPYQQFIDNGDIHYFFEKDYENDVSTLANSEKIINAINRIRDPIKNMSDTNQKHSMQYIQNLSKLSIIYHDEIN